MRQWLELSILLLLAVFSGEACGQPSYQDAYGALLAAHVRNGVVDYSGLKEQEKQVQVALDSMAAIDPVGLHEADRKAYYINAYNIWTIQLILEHWPGIRSIKEADSFIRSPWKRKFVRLHGGVVSLDDIEHGILRRNFPDPRVHFALNCASRSCPPLAAQPYRGVDLDVQLEAQTAAFINNPANTFVRQARLHVSRIFDWYSEDFGGTDGVFAFLRRYAGPQLAASLDTVTDRRLVFTDYDWSLNDRPLPTRTPETGDAAVQP
ncbi:hypothetical protein DVDV_2018 [Desulfovibrio sp. DV]|uniref:DUF547 domain-containing protein n=1 Tax=Desulfovibrio sp. DV TaxID=1844708 RepID=UPI00094B8221|nr:DUF547 domain-containing protein [Desulfovibrio sp. DV]OLN27682.1 hypothetical protein DVDV_2018 [Desulfovibrio sp. DV]